MVHLTVGWCCHSVDSHIAFISLCFVCPIYVFGGLAVHVSSACPRLLVAFPSFSASFSASLSSPFSSIFLHYNQSLPPHSLPRAVGWHGPKSLMILEVCPTCGSDHYITHWACHKWGVGSGFWKSTIFSVGVFMLHCIQFSPFSHRVSIPFIPILHWVASWARSVFNFWWVWGDAVVIMVFGWIQRQCGSGLRGLHWVCNMRVCAGFLFGW
jgi:hypothetical protein